MAKEQSLHRVAYSPGEFAELFGKSQTWGYRQIYQGKVNAITEHGRILIPAKEVERVLETAGIYNGREKPKAAQKRVENLDEDQLTIWQRFVKLREKPNHIAATSPKPKITESHPSRKWQTSSRKTVLGRLAKAWGKSAGR